MDTERTDRGLPIFIRDTLQYWVTTKFDLHMCKLRSFKTTGIRLHAFQTMPNYVLFAAMARTELVLR